MKKILKYANCLFYHEKCWFSHRNSKIDKMISNEKKNQILNKENQEEENQRI